jgi:hypothetical protein
LATYRGVQFDIRGLIQLKGRPESPSAQVTGIKVGQKCQRLHFLHATRQWVGEIEVGRYIIHTKDGRQKELPLVYGRDLRGWRVGADRDEPIPASNAALAWMGTSPAAQTNGDFLRLFMSTFENPFGEETVASIDFLSSSKAAEPFLIAVTVE